MAYNLVLSQSQEFSTLNSNQKEPYYQVWDFSPESPKEILYIPGGQMPSDFNLQIQLEDLSALYPKYDSFEWEAVPEPIVTFQSVVELSGDLTLNQKTPLPNDLQALITYSFKNFGILSSDKLTFFKTKFVFYGKYNSGITERLSYEKEFDIKVNIPSSSSYLFVSPDTLEFYHNKGTGLPASKNVQVTASGEWKFNVPKELNVTGSGVTSSVDNKGQKIVRGTGNTMVHVGFNFHIIQLSEGLHKFWLSYYDFWGNDFSVFETPLLRGAIIVELFLDTMDGNISTSLENFHFKGLRGKANDLSQPLTVYAAGNITLSENTFLNLSKTNGSNMLTTQVSVPPPMNMPLGTHKGYITINAENTTKEILVTYEVISSFSTNYNDSRFHFTKEPEKLSIFSMSDEECMAMIQLETTQGNETKIYNYEVPVLNGEGVFKLGLEVHRFFKTLEYAELFSANNNTQAPQGSIAGNFLGFGNYPSPLRVELSSTIKEIASGNLLGNDSFTTQFLKGNKPKVFGDYDGLMIYENNVQRVTSKGKSIINIASKNLSGKLKIYRNEEPIEEFDYTTKGENLLFKPLYFSAFSPGDKITVENNPTYADSENQQAGLQKKDFYVFPETKYSYHIAWVNECNAFQILEMTGPLGFNREYQRFTAETTDGFIEKLKVLESRKTLYILCNTGFILEGSIQMIDSLLASKSCWLDIEGKEPLELVPVAKKLKEVDTEKELYAYELKFKINAKNDAEVYTY